MKTVIVDISIDQGGTGEITAGNQRGEAQRYPLRHQNIPDFADQFNLDVRSERVQPGEVPGA